MGYFANIPDGEKKLLVQAGIYKISIENLIDSVSGETRDLLFPLVGRDDIFGDIIEKEPFYDEYSKIILSENSPL